MKYFAISFFFFISSCATTHKISEVKRAPSSFFPNYTCARIISMFAPNPYKKVYPLKNYEVLAPDGTVDQVKTFDNALKAFDDRKAESAPRVKKGAQSFRLIQEGPDGKPLQDRDVAVVLHGYSDSPGTMVKPSEFHHNLGHHVLANRLPDHGLKKPYQEEALNNSKLSEWRKSVDDTLAMAKAMAGKNGKVHIVGYSMGATLAMDASWRHPGLIATRVLHAPLFKEAGPVFQIPLYLLRVFTDGSFWKKNPRETIPGYRARVAEKGFLNPINYFTSMFDGPFFKQVELLKEPARFYIRMTYKQTIEMHRLTRQVQPRLLRKQDDIPTAVFRVDPESETTVDDRYIDKFEEVYGIEHRYMYINPEDAENPVLHRDFTSAVEYYSNEANPALDTIREGMNDFFSDQAAE